MWKNHPEIAKRWSDEYGSKPVPSKNKKKNKKRTTAKKKKGGR